MRTVVAGICTFVFALTVTAARSSSQERGVPSSKGGASSRTPVTNAQLMKWSKELSNWGRWGKDDELGALNLVTPAKRKVAVTTVKDGIAMSLAQEFDPTSKGPDGLPTYVHKMIAREFDQVTVGSHGGTHTDALGHRMACWSAEKGEEDEHARNCKPTAWNGYVSDHSSVVSAGGHVKYSVHALKNGIQTRAILFDIPRLKGVPYLKRGTKLYIEDLEAWEKKAGVKLSAGDALVVRTGVAVAPKDDTAPNADSLDYSVLPWLKQRDVAVIAADTSAPLAHFVKIIMGVCDIHYLNLEALSEALAARNRWDFLLTAAPMQIVGGTGSVLNPIATF